MPSKRFIAALGVAATAVALSAVTMHSADASGASASIAKSGRIAAAAPRLVNMSALPSNGTVHAWNHPALLRNGHFSGSQLPSRASSGHKAGAASPDLTTRQRQRFTGIDLTNSNCNCEPPDVNATIGPNNVVEAVNLDLAVYTRAGALQKSTGLNTFLGTSDPLSDPRVAYDPTWNRWALVLTDITAVSGTPSLWFAFSATSNPTGGWWVYHPGFSGGSFPAGELLDYPVLGMDADSFLVTSNNYTQPSAGNFTYNSSTAYTVPKARVYNGFGFAGPAFIVPFGTAPAIVGGHPTQNSGKTYLLSADDANNQMHVYYLTDTARPDTEALTHQADIAYTWAAPSRRVNQPGTSTTLDPLDGRIDWAPTQLDTRVWFAHGVDLSGFPGVDFGYVDVSANTITVNNAYHSGTSDDFNPSIAAENGPNGVQAVLSWASDNAPAGTATTDYTAVNLGTTLSHQGGVAFSPVGAITGETRFGDFSSVWPEYNAVAACGEGSYALVANQYFEANGDWTTRISQVGLC